MSVRHPLLDLEFPEIRHAYTPRDAILYALGVGIGVDPLDSRQLRYVYENGLVALPSLAVTLAYPGYWYRNLPTGLDHQKTVHASETFVIHRPLPTRATVVARPRVIEVIDRGRERGALVVSERVIRDAASGEPLATVRQTALCRGDGGFAATPAAVERPPPLPDRPADAVITLPTTPQAALIYQLSGDDNPLHCDPEFARGAGFARPILHGLATMGLICHAAVRLAFEDKPEALKTMTCRFTAPVYPGDAIATEFWREPPDWRFRASVGERMVATGDVQGVVAAPK